jgi:hypothetical protein
MAARLKYSIELSLQRLDFLAELPGHCPSPYEAVEQCLEEDRELWMDPLRSSTSSRR